MTNKILLSAIVLIFSLGLRAESAKQNAKSNDQHPVLSKEELETKKVMNEVYDSFVKIMPFIYSDKNFIETRDKKTMDELLSNLTDLQRAFKNANHVNFLKMPGFKPSLETINAHLQDTIDSVNFGAKNRVFAHARLKAMTALCVSCHSGLSERVSKNAFGEALANVKRDKFDSDFNYANYLYLVRRFTEAKTNYESALRSALSKTTSPNEKRILTDDRVLNGEIYGSLRRVLSIYTKISFKPDLAIDFLNRYKDNKNIKGTTKKDILHWIKELEAWKKFDINGVKDINEFITKNLSPIVNDKSALLSGKHDMTLLISSGILTKFLNENPQTEATPTILYWLAVSERRLSNTYFFSLADLYLKECITQFPKSPMAKNCYQEYEDSLTFGYTGSSGTDIPPTEKKELERLKALMK